MELEIIAIYPVRPCEVCGKPIPSDEVAEGAVYCSVQCYASESGQRDADIAHWTGYYEGM
jgi:predicted nucleic acid-binding Zn ribbon protein